MSNGQAIRVGGTHPAVGGARLAFISGNAIQVQQTSGAPFAATFPAPGADAVAVSAQWVAWRARAADGDTIFAVAAGRRRRRARVAKSAELGRPALEGARLAYHVTGRTGGRIVIADLATGKRSTVRRERRAMLLNPSLHGGELAYVRNFYRRQELRVGPQSRRSPQRDRRLWSTCPPAGATPGTIRARSTTATGGRRSSGRGPSAASRRPCGRPRWPPTWPTSRCCGRSSGSRCST